MSSDDQIVFVDIPSRPPCKTWSLNPWKTRFLLNYKGLNYKTEWVEYPDLKPRLEKHVQHNDGRIAYSSPSIMLPDGTYIMDSRVIASKIEELYPSPTVHLDSPILARLEEIMPQLMPTLVGIYLPLVPVRLLNEASHPHWYKTREGWVGMPLEQLKKERGGQDSWDAAKPFLDTVTAMLKKDNSGPYFMGQEVSYADFVWGGYLIFMQRLGTDVWESLLKTVGEDGDAHGKLVIALGKWSARDDQ